MLKTKSFFEQWGLRGNPFSPKAIYAEDTPMIYVPEMFGDQHEEFLRKFVLAPLEDGQPLMGAVWSVLPGDPKARGFGKSTLMGEEAKRINRDFGFSTLVGLHVEEDDARQNPVLASYVSFSTRGSQAIASIDAACFHLVRFLLRSADDKGVSVHQRLYERAAAELLKEGKAAPGHESQAIIQQVKTRFRKLAVTIDIRNLLDDYLNLLASPDTERLEEFLSSSVSSWHHDRNGLKYLQIFVVLAELAKIQHFTFFIDQVEDFTSVAQPAKIQKNVKIIRDALLESEPFTSRASFVFQLHPAAYARMRDAWRHEDLQDLDYDSPLNAPFVVVLKGLEKFQWARLLADRLLNDPANALPDRKRSLSPFTESSLKKVWQETKPKPRDFIRVLSLLMQLAKQRRVQDLDEAFVGTNLEAASARARSDEEGDEESSSDDRLA